MRPAALEVEAAQHRHVELERRAEHGPDHERQADQQAQRHRPHRRPHAGRLLLRVRAPVP